MNKLSKRSEENKKSCSEDLQIVIDTAIKHCPVDFGISCGHRTPEEQFEKFKHGRKFVNGEWVIVNRKKVITLMDGKDRKSKHNYYPSKAFDIYIHVPGRPDLAYDEIHLSFVAGYIMRVAQELYNKGKISKMITWGDNWDNDGELHYDHGLRDMPHFQEREE